MGVHFSVISFSSDIPSEEQKTDQEMQSWEFSVDERGSFSGLEK